MTTVNESMPPLATTSAEGALDEIREKFARFHAELAVPTPRRLVLINPPQVPEDMFSPDIARLKGYYAYPPVGLLYIAAVARTIIPAIELRIIDLNFEMLRRCHDLAFRYDFWTALLESLSNEPQNQRNCAESNPCKRAPAYARFKRFAKSPESKPLPQKTVWDVGVGQTLISLRI